MDLPAKAALVYLWAPFANLLWYVQTILMGTVSLLVWPFDRKSEMQHASARWWCRMVAVTIGARIHVHGVEHVQPGRSYVYVANHSSLIDTPALVAYLPYQFKIMAKRSLFYVPCVGWHLWSSGNFPIDRGDARKTAKSLKLVIDGVRHGKSLMVFAEGTRTADGRLQEFKHGAFKIAVRARVPVVSVAIRGTFERLPKTTLAPQPGRVDVFICSPIDTSECRERDLQGLVEAARNAIASKLAASTPVVSR
jgi:1-acyl-sn-glycerol-3-phosphate acyltransferase